MWWSPWWGGGCPMLRGTKGQLVVLASADYLGAEVFFIENVFMLVSVECRDSFRFRKRLPEHNFQRGLALNVEQPHVLSFVHIILRLAASCG
jgi:hypothetical protein